MLALRFQDQVPEQAGADFGGSTELHVIGVAALLLLAALAIVLPRRWSALPVILLLCFIPAGQRIVLATVDFTFVRLLMVALWLRLGVRNELRAIAWNHLDRTMILWAAISVLTGLMLGWNPGIVVNRLGTSLDALMIYFWFRIQIRNHRDLASIATQFLLCSFAVLGFLVVEHQTTHNLFSIFGGVPENTEVRDGRLRCQGAFAHAILAGCFWACLIPLYSLRGFLDRGWQLAGAGGLAAVAIVVLCASSTPVMSLLFGAMAGGAFLLRGALRWLRWLVLLWLAVLHFLIMKQPVWHLLARIDVVGGSTGWHRFHLVDKFFTFFPEWWLCGTARTGHWGFGLQDVTNQFVAEGVAGGIWRLTAFGVIIWLAFAGVSRSMRLPEAGRAYRLGTWAIGTALFMHCMNFIAISYFEQIVAQWNLLLAAVGSLTLVPGARPDRQLAGMVAHRS